jgi:DNA polymerase I
MLVRQSDFTSILQSLAEPRVRSLDCEATGLRVYHDARLFSLIIGEEEQVYYFNFQEYEDLGPEFILPRSWLREFNPIFASRDHSWALHNAKYDLALLWKEGLEVAGEIHCTMAIGRVLDNDRLKLSLDVLAKDHGMEKSDAVENYISENGLWDWEEIPGKKTRKKNLYFSKVPHHVIIPYGEQDGRITWCLRNLQQGQLHAQADLVPKGKPTVLDIAANEKKLTQVLFQMERTGIRVDAEYCREAAQYEMGRYEKAAHEFEILSGIPFRDSPKALEKAFIQAGEQYPRTEKGNPSFTDEVLKGFTTPLANLVREYRDAYKKCNTYYRNFLYHMDADGLIHANAKQSGTVTGRMSYSDPNLQNLNKEEDLEPRFLVRRSFIPRPGRFFFMIDYEQMEYRLMLDLAGEQAVIEKILQGLDVHEATAQMMGVSRQQAKTLNFMLLYGGGAQKLADALGLTLREAYALKDQYFSALPRVQTFIRRVMLTAEQRGFIFNWAGRICRFKDKTFSYAGPNHLIQGGCADIMKIGMVRIAEFLAERKAKTQMLVQVHDELVFEGVEEEKHLIPEVKRILETVYPYKHLPLTCSVSYSHKSWADKVEGIPE